VPKVTLNRIATDQQVVETTNANAATMEQAFENTLSRDGTAPNQMAADLDMNLNRILNCANGIADTDAINRNQLVEYPRVQPTPIGYLTTSNGIKSNQTEPYQLEGTVDISIDMTSLTAMSYAELGGTTLVVVSNSSTTAKSLTMNNLLIYLRANL